MMCYFAGVMCTSPGGAKITNIQVAYGRTSIFCNFQNASPLKCSGHFPRNSTQLHSSTILQTGRVSASVLFPILAMTCEHARIIEISIMREVNFWEF